ncbi:17.5 kDa class I heat shock protein [Spatholobus suberectus]|nr:17.5 kDa class I heat shock protein [Spatholobus suberectus]
MKEKETTVIPCVIGVCALVSPARSLLCKLSELRGHNGLKTYSSLTAEVWKEDLKVQVEENKILQKSGKRVQEKEDQNDNWHYVERRCANFLQWFQLPEDTNTDQIGCTLENEVLTLTVPKMETKLENKNVRQIDVA